MILYSISIISICFVHALELVKKDSTVEIILKAKKIHAKIKKEMFFGSHPSGTIWRINVSERPKAPDASVKIALSKRWDCSKEALTRDFLSSIYT